MSWWRGEMSGVRTWWTVCVVFAVVALLAVPEAASAGIHVGRNVQVFNNSHYQVETAIAVNPTDDRNLIAAAIDGRLSSESCEIAIFNVPDCTSWVGVYASLDGGKSWLAQLVPGYPGGPPGALSEFQFGIDPVVAFDHQGNAYAGGAFGKIRGGSTIDTFETYDGSIAIARSDDGGRTWNEAVVVAHGHELSPYNDHPHMAVDVTGGRRDGSVYVTWSVDDGDGGWLVMLASSVDRGMSWSSVQVSGPHLSGDPSATNFDPMVTVGPGGEVFVVWDEEFVDVSGSVTSENLWMAVSRNGGRTFSHPRMVETGVVPDPVQGYSYTVLAIDTSRGDHRGRLYLTWGDARSGNADILLKWSDDRGVTWSSSIRVNDDDGAAEQYNPWISVAPNGRIDIAFYDRRDDPNNVLNTRYYAGSKDGGLTFQNIRVSDASWDPAAWPFYPGFDDYDQIVSTAHAAHLVWVDGRNVQPGGENMDIYAATVVVQGRGNDENDESNSD